MEDVLLVTWLCQESEKRRNKKTSRYLCVCGMKGYMSYKKKLRDVGFTRGCGIPL